MKYPVNLETLGSGIPRLVLLAVVCFVTGASIGMVEAIVGYAPGWETLGMAPSAAMIGGMIGECWDSYCAPCYSGIVSPIGSSIR
jgi:hypothetical protein